MLTSPKVYRDAHGSLVSDSAFNWTAAKSKIESGDIVFGRTIEEAQTYRENLMATKEEWESIDSYCKHHFLNYPFSTKVKNGKVVKYVGEGAKSQGKCEMALHKNNFPYNMTPDIGHYVVWASQGQSRPTYEEFIAKCFPPNVYEVMFYENFERNKSVKSVEHVQVFVRKRPINIAVLPPDFFRLC